MDCDIAVHLYKNMISYCKKTCSGEHVSREFAFANSP